MLNSLNMNRPKMKIFFKFLFAPLFCLFQGCSPLGNPVDIEKSDSHYYNRLKSQIRYSPMGNWFELGNTEMKADVESFQVFNSLLSKDKDHVFFKAVAVENAAIDLSTFKVSAAPYMTDIGFDKNYVYAFSRTFKNKGYRGEAKVIDGADFKNYMRTDWDWANDGKHYFYRDKLIAADFDSFQTLNDYFVKDNSSVYVRNEEVFRAFEANVSSFRILGKSNHGIDNKNVYWLPFFTKNSTTLNIIPYKNEAEVEFLNRYFLRIANAIYFDGAIRKDIDADSFEIIDHSYAKDNNHVYFKNKIIPNADPTSFKQLEGSYKYVDKNGIYYEGKLEEKK